MMTLDRFHQARQLPLPQLDQPVKVVRHYHEGQGIDQVLAMLYLQGVY